VNTDSIRHGTGLVLVLPWLLAGCSAHQPQPLQRTAEPVPALAASADTTMSHVTQRDGDAPGIIFETYRKMEYIRDCNKNGLDDDEDIDRHVEDDFNGNRIPDPCDPQDDVARFVGPGDNAIPDSSMLMVRYAPPDLIIFRYYVPRPSRVVLSIESDGATRILFDRHHARGWMEWPWVPMLEGKTLTAQGQCSAIAIIGNNRHRRVVAWSYSDK